MPTCPHCKFQWVSTTRSTKQNRYMHGVVFSMIAEEMGEWDIEHVKDLMKEKFLTIEKETITKSGKEIVSKKIRHTSELDTREMESFLEKCRYWAKDFLGIYIPEPLKDDNVCDCEYTEKFYTNNVIFMKCHKCGNIK